MDGDDDEIEREALRALASANGGPIILIGSPVGTGQLPDQSKAVEGKCTNCGRSVQSTVIKQKILEIAKSPVQLLCVECMMLFLQETTGHDS